MHFVEFSEQAELDADKASEYYDKQVAGLGLRFLEDLEKSIRSVKNRPSTFHFFKGDTNIRRCNLGVFPYSIYYTINGEMVF